MEAKWRRFWPHSHPTPDHGVRSGRRQLGDLVLGRELQIATDSLWTANSADATTTRGLGVIAVLRCGHWCITACWCINKQHCLMNKLSDGH